MYKTKTTEMPASEANRAQGEAERNGATHNNASSPVSKTTLTNTQLNEFECLSKIKRSAEQEIRYLKLRHIAFKAADKIEASSMMKAEARRV